MITHKDSNQLYPLMVVHCQILKYSMIMKQTILFFFFFFFENELMHLDY